MLLLTDRDERAREVGERAVAALLAVWSPSARDVALKRRSVPEEWTEDWSRRLSLDPEDGDLAEVVERLGRLGAGPAPLVVDPLLDSRVRTLVPDRKPAKARLEGAWGELLAGLAKTHRISFEVLGYRPPGDVGAVSLRIRRSA